MHLHVTLILYTIIMGISMFATGLIGGIQWIAAREGNGDVLLGALVCTLCSALNILFITLHLIWLIVLMLEPTPWTNLNSFSDLFHSQS